MSLLGAAHLDPGRHAEPEPPIVVGHEGIKAREARLSVPARTRLQAAAEQVVRL